MTNLMKIGCCGFPVNLKKYFESFPLVEIQKTFYAFPKAETVRRWRSLAPEGFEFTVKASQIITHPPESPTYRKTGLKVKEGGFFLPVESVFQAYVKTAELARLLEARIILFQCPASFRFGRENVENMRRFFGALERDFTFVWEPRGDWKPEAIRAVCKELDLVHCVDPFEARQAWGSFAYYRLHGIGGYRHRHSDEELQRLSVTCKEGDYVLFNNMYEDAERFGKDEEGVFSG